MFVLKRLFSSQDWPGPSSAEIFSELQREGIKILLSSTKPALLLSNATVIAGCSFHTQVVCFISISCTLFIYIGTWYSALVDGSKQLCHVDYLGGTDGSREKAEMGTWLGQL